MITRQGIILLVEDEASDVFLMQRAFDKVKLVNPVQTVPDGDQAISYLKGQGQYRNREQHPLPEIIFLDLKMPRRSGLEVLAWIREQEPPIRRIPIVVLTSSKQSNDVNRAYELGANSYLVKPAAFEGLIDMVKALETYWFSMNEQPAVESDNPQPCVDHGTVSSSFIN